MHPDYASSHIDKIFEGHRIFSSSILCVMTSTDNTIDAVVMCVNKSTKCLDPPLLKQISILSVSIHWGKYCGYCFKKKKKVVEESCLPHYKKR